MGLLTLAIAARMLEDMEMRKRKKRKQYKLWQTNIRY